MEVRMRKRIALIAAVFLGTAMACFAQQGATEAGKKRAAPPPRPDPLAFREKWTAPGNEHFSVSQKSLGNPDLDLHLYGSGKDMDTVAENGGPLHVWTGNCL